MYLGSRDTDRGLAACKDLEQELGADLCAGRLEHLSLDVTDDASVAAAAAAVQSASGGDNSGSLYGLVNNAGVGFWRTVEETLATNLYGVRRVTDAFVPLLCSNGRIVNIASASGPNFVASQSPDAKRFWADPVREEKVVVHWYQGSVVSCLNLRSLDEWKRSG